MGPNMGPAKDNGVPESFVKVKPAPGEEWLFLQERILINHHVYIYTYAYVCI